MSTDTALALGLLALLGRDMPDRMRVFVLTVFVVDDLVALAVIALVYSDDIVVAPLVLAVVAFVLLLVAVRLRLQRRSVYVAARAWSVGRVAGSGIDPVVTGLAIGLAAPAYTPTRDDLEEATGLVRRFREQPTPELARSAQLGLDAALSPNARLQSLLPPVDQLRHRAAVRAGQRRHRPRPRTSWPRPYTSPITLGVIVGYVVGKPVAVVGGSWRYPAEPRSDPPADRLGRGARQRHDRRHRLHGRRC